MTLRKTKKGGKKCGFFNKLFKTKHCKHHHHHSGGNKGEFTFDKPLEGGSSSQQGLKNPGCSTCSQQFAAVPLLFPPAPVPFLAIPPTFLAIRRPPAARPCGCTPSHPPARRRPRRPAPP